MLNNSTISIIPCPQCGYICHEENNYIVNEQHIDCYWCGYEYNKFMDGSVSEKTGYGTVHEYTPNGENITKLHHNSNIESLKEHLNSNNALYVWDNDNLSSIVGILPKSYNEYIQELLEEQQYYNSCNDKAYRLY